MTEKLDLTKTDKKVLSYLYKHSRESQTTIAKDLQLTRDQVSYRINKFESENIIIRYLPIVNYSKLGYHVLNLVFFKFNEQKHLNEFKSKIKNSKHKILTMDTLTKYDLIVFFIFKNEKQRNDYLSELINENHEKIEEYKVIEPYFSELYPLKFLEPKNKDFHTTFLLHEYKQEEYELDEKEKKILLSLNKNANKKIIDIAKETDLSSELILYKIRKLKKEKVLITTRAYFDMTKIGHHYSFIMLNIKNFSKETKQKIRGYALESKHVDSLNFNLGKPNYLIQIFHENIDQLHKEIENIKDILKDENLTLELVPLKNEGENVNTIPFL